MAITQAAVIRLILQHIGGQKLRGNVKQVKAGGATIAVQAAGLSGGLSSLISQFSSVSNAITGLVQNPIAGLTSQLSSLASGLNTQVLGLSIAGDLQSELTSKISSLSTAISGVLAHTNILSGVVQDVESIPDGMLSLSELIALPAEQAQGLAGTLFRDQEIDKIRQSLDPSVGGGVSGLMSALSSTTDPTSQANLTDHISKLINDHTDSLNTMVSTDVNNQASYRLNQDLTNLTSSLIPADTSHSLFQRVATNSLKASL